MFTYWINAYYHQLKGPSWSWSYGSWIYKYLCNQISSLVKFLSYHDQGLQTWYSL